MVVIGLTGGIASGKSTVSRMLAERGAQIIDADVLAREIVRPGRPAWREIVAYFGREILEEDGEINRKLLARRIFHDAAARERLNRITHPRVMRMTAALLRQIAQSKPCAVAVVDAPLLFEAGMDTLVDEVWLVKVAEETQIKRLMARDGLSREEAERRLAAQMPLVEKIRRAHRVIDNEGPLSRTRQQVERYWKELVERCPSGSGA